MTFTRRGRLVGVAIVLGLLWGFVFRIPTLNAVVMPGVVGLLAGWFLVSRADPPALNRSPVEADFAGNARVVQLQISHPNTVAVQAADDVPASVTVSDGQAARPVVDGSMAYEVVADERGIAALGPVTVRYTDPLGLYAHSFELGGRIDLITFPQVHQLDWWAARSALRSEGTPTRERHVFDRLREYDPGDALRDIHWRSSAKRQEHEFIVKEFVADSERGAVRIVGESAAGRADDMASAVASVALWLLDDGIPVGVELADTTVPVAGGPPQRRRILMALARTDGGRVDPETRRAAPVLIQGERASEVSVEVGERDVDFEDVLERTGATRSTRTIAADGGHTR